MSKWKDIKDIKLIRHNNTYCVVPKKENEFVADTNDEVVMLYTDHSFGIVYYYDVREQIPLTGSKMMNVVYDDDDDKIYYWNDLNRETKSQWEKGF